MLKQSSQYTGFKLLLLYRRIICCNTLTSRMRVLFPSPMTTRQRFPWLTCPFCGSRQECAIKRSDGNKDCSCHFKGMPNVLSHALYVAMRSAVFFLYSLAICILRYYVVNHIVSDNTGRSPHSQARTSTINVPYVTKEVKMKRVKKSSTNRKLQFELDFQYNTKRENISADWMMDIGRISTCVVPLAKSIIVLYILYMLLRARKWNPMQPKSDLQLNDEGIIVGHIINCDPVICVVATCSVRATLQR